MAEITALIQEYYRLIQNPQISKTSKTSQKRKLQGGKGHMFVGYGITSYCPWSQKAKELLESHGGKFYDLETEKGQYENKKHQTKVEELREKHATIPIVFKHDTHIGGFSELEKVLTT